MKDQKLIKSAKYKNAVCGHKGKPAHYPIIDGIDGLLFYIQRNQNINTVTYRLNYLHDGMINLQDPIKIEWIKYKECGARDIMDINYIQRSLAYGYDHNVISKDLIEFTFAPYKLLKFYLVRDGEGTFVVKTKLQGQLVILDHLYVFAEDLGVFPQVKFVEFFTITDDTKQPFYHKLVFEQH